MTSCAPELAKDPRNSLPFLKKAVFRAGFRPRRGLSFLQYSSGYFSVFPHFPAEPSSAETSPGSALLRRAEPKWEGATRRSRGRRYAPHPWTALRAAPHGSPSRNFPGSQWHEIHTSPIHPLGRWGSYVSHHTGIPRMVTTGHYRSTCSDL